MPKYYLWFALGIVVFVLLLFIQSFLFWKRVQRAKDLAELSASDQKQYEKFRMEWPHDILATQKIYETKLMMVAFGIISVISVLIYWYLSSRL